VNTNDYVWVRLTEPGLATLDAYYKEVQKQIGELVKDMTYEPAKFPVEDGFHRIQMWILMHVFGPAMYNGNLAPFEENVIHLTKPGSCPESQAARALDDKLITNIESPSPSTTKTKGTGEESST